VNLPGGGGGADIYPRLAPTCEWTSPGAHAVVVAAGGKVTDAAGNALRFGGVNEGSSCRSLSRGWGRQCECERGYEGSAAPSPLAGRDERSSLLRPVGGNSESVRLVPPPPTRIRAPLESTRKGEGARCRRRNIVIRGERF